MNLFILDASVIIGFFLKEKDNYEKAKIFFQKVDRGMYRILLPSIWFYEVANTIGRLQIPQAYSYREKLCLYRDKFFTTVELEPKVSYIAFSIMDKYKKISFYDASYHALALHMNGKFLTNDKNYFETTKGEGAIELF